MTRPRKGGSRPRKRGRRRPAQQRTSLPTSRNAYTQTRQWLLDRHGPVCAYCERRVTADSITMDHVTPRKGKTAYDRRDNLVLACPSCNALKADMPFLGFLLARRSRAGSLLRYGSHLSPMLLDLAREIAGPEAAARAERLSDPDYPYLD
ncbi:MAG: HNH endonuclease [Gemmatimonadaceae bacterium]